MVLIFSDWSNYTDETGAARSIDWSALEGQPRSAAAEAIRQALAERLGRLVASPAAYLALRETDFPGVSMLLDPIPEGVDLDGIRRLQCMEWLLEDIASPAGRWPNGYVSSVGADPEDRTWVWDTLDPIADDVLSAQWAMDMRAGIDACRQIWLLNDYYSDGRLFLSGGRMDPTYATDRTQYGTVAMSRALLEPSTLLSWAEFVAQFEAAPWNPVAWGSGGFSYSNRATMVVGNTGIISAYRDRASFQIFDQGIACTISVYATYSGAPFPEGSPTGYALDGSAGPSSAPNYVVRDSKALPASPPSVGTSVAAVASLTYTPARIFLDFAVPGGFTFQETP